MSVAKVTEISATSSEGFEAAIRAGIARASQTVRNIKSAWINEQHVSVENGNVTAYRVNMKVTFLLD